VAYQSFIGGVISDLKRGQEKALDKAAAHVVKKLKEKVSDKNISKPGDPPGSRTKDLKKGLRWVNDGIGRRKVGPGKPAYHAHLLELGAGLRTGLRVVKNYRGHKGVTKDVGPMAARPFMVPTFEEEADTVEQILSEEWV
jgi:HK97 gp10 family phage protein